MDSRWLDLFSFRGKGKNIKIKAILEEFGFKQNFNIINVVGTNGKGSVSNYIYQGLRSADISVGLFTSPHIYEPNERIVVNDIEISDDSFFEIYDLIKDKLILNQCNFFSSIFIVAMLYFQKQDIEYLILEAGIGARFDSTTIFPGIMGIVTSIGKDHMELFGKTLKDVANDKAGFINKNMSVLIPYEIHEKQEFEHEASRFNIKIQYIKLSGNYHTRNQKLASEALKVLGINFTNFKLIPGRSEIFKNNGFTTIFDVAHNVFGIKNSLEYLNQKTEFNQVVLSLAKRKPKDKLLKMFFDKEVFVYQVDETFWSAKDFGLSEIKDINTFYEKQNKATLYIGSFYLIGAIDDKGKK